jgi:circadian clock protein KaiC
LTSTGQTGARILPCEVCLVNGTLPFSQTLRVGAKQHRNVHAMHEHSSPEPSVVRIPTGIRCFDTILGGGFTAGSVQLLIGKPGTGKTIFANQFAFHHASTNHTAAYVTLLAESHARMLKHLAGFSFFDPELVSRRILYMSGYDVLEQSGLDGLLDLLTRTIREHGASLLIIDGLTTAKEFAQTTTAFKRFLLRLSTSASLTSCTTLLVSSVDGLSGAQPEDSTVDGIIRLDKQRNGAQVIRELTVEKMRATNYPLGRHAHEIDAAGIHVWPRIESLPVAESAVKPSARRLEFGIRGLDELLGGGVLEGSSTAIFGTTGTGKTLLGISFLARGVQQDQPGVYVGLREPPSHIVHQARSVGIDLDAACRQDKLTLLWLPPLEGRLDAIAWRLFDVVERGKKQRVFIDGIEGFVSMLVYPSRLPRFYTALIANLAARGATTVMAEVLPVLNTATTLLSQMSPNNVLTLGEIAKRHGTIRTLAALKIQGSAHDLTPKRLYISDMGLAVGRRWRDRIGRDKP